MILTYEVRRRLDRVIEAGYIIRHSRDYSMCSLTEKGMAVLLAEADIPLQVGDLVRTSLAEERLWTDASRARRQNNE